MKAKLFYTFFLLVFSMKLFSQELSYGILIGRSADVINNNIGIEGFGSDVSDSPYFFGWVVGGYTEYQLNNSLGLKAELNYNNKKVDYFYVYNDVSIDNIELSFIDLSLDLKYDFGTQYRHGFYVFIGPNISFLTGKNINTDIIKKNNIGSNLGFGCRVYKYFDIQGTINIGLTPFYENNFSDSYSKFNSFYLTLNTDFQRIIGDK